MATKQIFTFGMLAMLSLAACVKDPLDIPGGFDGDPVFRFSGQFGQQSIDLRAGEELWTMWPIPDARDSFHLFSGLFSRDACLMDCAPSLRFDFYQSALQALPAATAFSQTIVPGELSVVQAGPGRDSLAVEIATNPGLFMSGYSFWEDQGGPPVTMSPTYTQVIGPEGAIDVCFQSYSFTGCQYSQCVYFQPAAGPPCVALLQAEWLEPGYAKLTVWPQGQGPFNFEWYHGQTSQSIIVPVQNPMGELLASVTVTDGVGNRAELTQLVRILDGFVDPCFFPIDISITPVATSFAAGYAGKADVLYTDETGAVWQASAANQPDDAFFLMNSVEPYGDSPAGDPAVKAEISFRLLLRNPLTGEERWLMAEEATIALSYRE